MCSVDRAAFCFQWALLSAMRFSDATLAIVGVVGGVGRDFKKTALPPIAQRQGRITFPQPSDWAAKITLSLAMRGLDEATKLTLATL